MGMSPRDGVFVPKVFFTPEQGNSVHVSVVGRERVCSPPYVIHMQL